MRDSMYPRIQGGSLDFFFSELPECKGDTTDLSDNRLDFITSYERVAN